MKVCVGGHWAERQYLPEPASLTKTSINMSLTSSGDVDAEYPGTAVSRMQASRAHARALSHEALSGEWESVRKRLLAAAGLKDLPHLKPGKGNTSHAFNNYNHCDAVALLTEVYTNANGAAAPLGPGIEIASLPELGEGGSWATASNGCHTEPPQDIAHAQLRSRIAWKLVWCPPAFTRFVLIDDSGALLATGDPRSPGLPSLEQRAANFRLVLGSKYSEAALVAGAAA